MIVYLLAKEFGFKFKNIAPILGYPTREEIRQMEAQGLRLLERSSPGHEDGKRMLAAAKAIIAKATEPT